MVSKRFCDICGIEIKDCYAQRAYDDYSYPLIGHHIEFCRNCGAKVRDFIESLLQEQEQLRFLTYEASEIKGQKKIDDFLNYF